MGVVYSGTSSLGTIINSAVLSFVERLSSFRGSKCTKTIGHVIFGTSNSVLCREVYYTVSLFQRVHYIVDPLKLEKYNIYSGTSDIYIGGSTEASKKQSMHA